MVIPDLNFTPPEEDDVHIPEGEHADTLSTRPEEDDAHIPEGQLNSFECTIRYAIFSKPY
jgi:hypothetical protein